MTTTRSRAAALADRVRSSSRVKLAGALVLVVALAAFIAGIGLQAMLHGQSDERIRGDLVQEYREFVRFLEVAEDDNGERLSRDLRRATIRFLDGSVLSEGEVVFVLSGAGLLRSSGPVGDVDLAADPAVRNRAAAASDSSFFEVSTGAGPARMLAVPVLRDENRIGTFVVGRFVDGERETVRDVLSAVRTVGLIAVLITAVASWWLAAVLLRPLRRMSDTARTISATDTSERLHDPGGSDEIAVLARTFNSMLDRLDGALGTQRTFLADAAHDLRTPLTIIRGHIEQLRDGTVAEDEVDDTVAMVADEVERMSRMVNDLIVLARAEQPTFLRVEPVDLSDLALAVHRRAQTLPGPQWHPVVGVGVIQADADRLTQAMLNLVENAARYAAEDSVVEIGTTVDPGGRTASLWVSDRGPGVPEDERTRVFQRHVSGPERARQGSGLGLAIARAIAEAHGGTLRLDANWHPGSRFVITVPVDSPHATEVTT